MKICIVSQLFAPQSEGGAEISTRHAAANLSARHEVVVLSLGQANDTDAPVGECPTGQNYRLYRIPFQNSYLPAAQRSSFGLSKRALWHARNTLGSVDAAYLGHFLQTENFDLIYCQNSALFQPAIYTVATDLGIPICQHLRDYALICPRTSMYRNGTNCETSCISCRILKAPVDSTKVGTAIAVSNFVKQRYLKHGLFATADFHVMHNTNTARADFDADLLAHRPPPTDVFTFGYLGALSKEKGVSALLEAFLRLPLEMPVRLILAGRGRADDAAAFHIRTKELPKGRLEWLDHVSAETVFAQSDVVMVPSLWHEPQSRVLVEAATYGIPVIAARTGGSPEIVEIGRMGWCYDPADTPQLSNLMTQAAAYGAKAWRDQLDDFFPGLKNYKGTAEDTNYYEKLEAILKTAVAK